MTNEKLEQMARETARGVEWQDNDQFTPEEIILAALKRVEREAKVEAMNEFADEICQYIPDLCECERCDQTKFIQRRLKEKSAHLFLTQPKEQ